MEAAWSTSFLSFSGSRMGDIELADICEGIVVVVVVMK